MTAQHTATPATRTAPAAAARRARRAAVTALAGLTGAGFAAMSLGALAPAAASAAVPVNCQAAPSACGFPDATTTGVPAGMTLLSVPAQITSGPGWSYNAVNQQMNVTGANAVISGLSITCNLNITASGVTINNDKITTGGSYGISLRHTANVTVENSTVSGLNATTGRVDSAVADLYGDSTGMVIKNNNITAFRTGVQVSSGLVTGNYIHDPGYLDGDHTNGIYVGGGTTPLTISGNTILNPLAQTDAINLDASVAGPVSAKTVTGNLLAGGGYPIYAGSNLGNTTTAITITGNRFGQAYYPKSGQWGPAAYYTATGTGNTWTGNIWDTTAQTVPSP
jgi:Right handed beta helix region